MLRKMLETVRNGTLTKVTTVFQVEDLTGSVWINRKIECFDGPMRGKFINREIILNKDEFEQLLSLGEEE